MPRPKSPSMPTEQQIKSVIASVCAQAPGARVRRVGPDGIQFAYPDESTSGKNDPSHNDNDPPFGI